jgi:hypothetical protein
MALCNGLIICVHPYQTDYVFCHHIIISMDIDDDMMDVILNNNNNNNLNHYHKGLSARGFLPTAGFIGLAEPLWIPCVVVSPMKVDCCKAIKKDFVL